MFHTPMKTYLPQSIKQLESLSVNKGTYFKNFTEAFDTALPEDWLDDFAKWCEQHVSDPVTYHLILSSTVWSYSGNVFGEPVTCCKEVKWAYDRYIKVTAP